MNNINIIKELSKYILDTENLANEFLPLDTNLKAVKDDLDSTLSTLKTKIDTSTELSDQVFYMNRYLDLVKKVDSVFDTRSKRIQYALSTLIKVQDSVEKNDLLNDNTSNNIENNENNVSNAELSPEDAMKIVELLRH